MPRLDRSTTIVAITAVTVLMGVRPALGQGSLTVDPSSTLVASGNVAGSTITAQGPGSLSTTYSGAVGVSSFNPSAATLTIDSLSTSFTAAVSGSWAPMAGGAAGTAPANYGGAALVLGTDTVDFAIRGASFNINGSPTVSLTSSGGGSYTFPANQTLAFLGGSLDYRDSLGLAASSVDLTGRSATNMASTSATLQLVSVNTYTLSYPVSLTVTQTITTGVTATIVVQGTITAQGTITPVPEPYLPLSLCFSACGAVAVWRRAKPGLGPKMAKCFSPLT